MRTGKVVNVRQVGTDDQVVLITDHGKVIRLGVKQVRITGRNAQGVHLVRLEPSEKVRAVSPPGRTRRGRRLERQREWRRRHREIAAS